MNLDTLLEQPLAPVRDDGFSVSVLLRLRRAEEKRRLLLWGAEALALLPLLWGLTLIPLDAGLVAAMARAAASPLLSYGAGALVLLWALRPRPHSF
jgi:hypothetical protein